MSILYDLRTAGQSVDTRTRTIGGQDQGYEHGQEQEQGQSQEQEQVQEQEQAKEQGSRLQQRRWDRSMHDSLD